MQDFGKRMPVVHRLQYDRSVHWSDGDMFMFEAFILEAGVIRSGSVLATCTDMYATAQYSVHIRKDIQDVFCFAVLNVSSRHGHGQALECLVVGTWSIKVSNQTAISYCWQHSTIQVSSCIYLHGNIAPALPKNV